MNMRENFTFVWEDIKAEPGQFVTGKVKVAELSHGSPVYIPVLVVNGAKPGPSLWLNGAVHGDELNGPMAIRNLLPRLDPGNVSGIVIATPICNPFAFQARQKNTPQDGLDMDMQFPGDPRGTLSQRMARVLFEQVREYADYLLDFHALGTPYDALPYTVFKRVPGAGDDVCDRAERMARVFGGTAHCRVDLGGNLNELPGNVKGFLDVQCLLHGIPSFMAEIGSGGQIQPDMVEFGERGILAVMHDLGMWPEPPATTERIARYLPEHPVTLTRRKFLYTDRGGIVVDSAPSGTFLKKGDLVCRIVDMFGTVKEVVAEEDMYIIAHRDNPPVDTGDRVSFVGVEWEETQHG
jgi:predicted deacylase